MNWNTGEDLRLNEQNSFGSEGLDRCLAARCSLWHAATVSVEILQPQALQKQVNDELRAVDQVASPQAPWLLQKPKEPFKAAFAHPRWCLFPSPRKHIKGRASKGIEFEKIAGSRWRCALRAAKGYTTGASQGVYAEDSCRIPQGTRSRCSIAYNWVAHV